MIASTVNGAKVDESPNESIDDRFMEDEEKSQINGQEIALQLEYDPVKSLAIYEMNDPPGKNLYDVYCS